MLSFLNIWICGLVSVINFGTFLSINVSDSFLAPFILLFLVFQLCTFYTFWKFPQFWMSCFVFFFLFLLYFSLGNFCDLSSMSTILSSAMSSLLIAHQGNIPLLLQYLWFLMFSFCIFLELPSLCLYYLSVLLCCLLFH